MPLLRLDFSKCDWCHVVLGLLSLFFGLRVPTLERTGPFSYFLILLAQRFKFTGVEIFQVEQAILSALGNAQEFVELDVQGIVVTVLCVLDQEHHEKRNNGRGSVDDQLPRIVVMKDRAWPAQFESFAESSLNVMVHPQGITCRRNA